MASRALKISPKKRGTRRPADSPEQDASETVRVRENVIAVLAYHLWQEQGCPFGSDQDDWFQAEKELKQLAQSPRA